MQSTISKLFYLLDSRDRLHLFFLMGILMLVALVEVIGIASILPFMSVVTNPDVIHTNSGLSTAYQFFNFDSDQEFLIFLGTVVLGLLIFGNLAKATSTWLTLRYHNKLYYIISRRLLAKYMARPYAFFLGRNTSELGKNILGEVQVVVAGILDPATTIISSGLVCAAIMTLLIVVNPVVAAVIALVLGGAYGSVYLLARTKLGVIGSQQVFANRQKYKNAAEALSGIKELKVLGREITFLLRFAKYAKNHAHNNISAGIISQVPRFALEIVAFGGILLVVLYFIRQGQDAAQMVPLLALYAFAGYRLMPALQQLFGAVSSLRFSVAALDVVYEDFRSDEDESWDAEQELATIAKIKPLPFIRCLELSGVSFRYEGASRKALEDLTLRVNSNSCIGLVGPTGCGKTTSVDLILGLLTPTHGRIIVDGTPVDETNRRNWQRNIGYVPQHIYISDDTIARNIAFGVPDDEIDMDSVEQAARIANLADFVKSDLPEGYDTGIGEHGVRLSGGQRQRIGIARAMYKDPAILIMDEATSALDGITEESVMDAVHNLSHKKTIILIAHRLTTVKDCDQIFQLEEGRIVAQGTYDELLRDSQWFRAAAGG